MKNFFGPLKYNIYVYILVIPVHFVGSTKCSRVKSGCLVQTFSVTRVDR